MKSAHGWNLVSWVVGALLVVACGAPDPDPRGEVLPFTVERAGEWDRLFLRYSGWTGGDGIYSVPVSGYDAPGRAAETVTAFLFNDSFIGAVDRSSGRRSEETRFVHSAAAMLVGDRPSGDLLRFFWGEDGVGGPGQLFPAAPRVTSLGRKKNRWHWNGDGIVLDGTLHPIAMLVEKGTQTPGGRRYRVRGTTLISVPISGTELSFSRQRRVPAPLLHTFPGGRLYYGVAIQANTEAAGAPLPDGYVYVYGRYRIWMQGAPIQLVVARVRPEDFEDFAAWRFWDGAGWSGEISDSRPLGIGGAELSVTPMTAPGYRGRYLLIAMHFDDALFYRIGSSPHGPFGPPRELFRPHEKDLGAGSFS